MSVVSELQLIEAKERIAALEGELEHCRDDRNKELGNNALQAIYNALAFAYNKLKAENAALRNKIEQIKKKWIDRDLMTGNAILEKLILENRPLDQIETKVFFEDYLRTRHDLSLAQEENEKLRSENAALKLRLDGGKHCANCKHEKNVSWLTPCTGCENKSKWQPKEA